MYTKVSIGLLEEISPGAIFYLVGLSKVGVALGDMNWYIILPECRFCISLDSQ